MKNCYKCNNNYPESKFVKYTNRSGIKCTRNYCYKCKYKEASPVCPDKTKSYMKTYYSNNFKYMIYKSYRHNDSIKGFKTIEKEQFDSLVTLNCFYCDKPKCGGLDRIDNKLGHEISNVRPCCEKCNNILGDLPDKAKLIMKDSLKRINNEGILEEWIIPTKRKKT